MFRAAFKRSRCIVPASGYYEWKTINGAKQPFYFSAAGGGVLSIAGLWEEWSEPLQLCRSPGCPVLLQGHGATARSALQNLTVGT
jgi:putative SOS response-associated peptidase YedK